MQIGAILPQMEMPGDLRSLREWVAAAEELGYSHIVMYDHVLGVDPAVHVGWDEPYDVHTNFHEVFTTLAYLAGITRLGLALGVLVLPQRQTAVVAKQAAQLAIVSEGRFRLGVGLGWNRIEMEALGESYGDRGRRMEEQIDVMRQLWMQQSVTFDGSFHRLRGVGLAPRPPVALPVWIGGSAPAALERIGRVGDGWFAQPSLTDEQYAESWTTIADAARRAGRDPSGIAVEGRLMATVANRGDWASQVDTWRARGASHLSIATMGDGLTTAAEHIDRLAEVAEVLP